MADLIKLNGAAVSAVGFHKKELAQPDGPAVEEYQIAVMIRGRMTHRSFATILESGTIRLEVGSNSPRETTVAAAAVTSTGGGESAVYRHDFTLRETPESAIRRHAAETGPDPKLAELAVFIKDASVEEPGESEADDPSVDTWATALQKLTGASPAATATAPPKPTVAPASSNGHNPGLANGTAPATYSPVAPPVAPQPMAATPSLPPPPASLLASPALTGHEVAFSPVELAGIEAVLVGLRIETVIDALDKLEILPRSEIEQAFLRLVRERFVAEATLVVGEPIARRAARDILHGLGVGRWSLGDRR